MKNLACNNPSLEQVEASNASVLEEMEQAGIIPVIHPSRVTHSEVPTMFTGKAGNIMFKRAWYYWVISGLIPLATAEKLYNNPIGKKDVRVQGHCGCPPPIEWATKIDKTTGKFLVDDEEYARGLRLFVNMPEAKERWITSHIPESESQGYDLFITSYHIDSQEGLNLFLKTLREDGIIS